MKNRPSYMTNGAGLLSKNFNCSIQDVKKAKKIIRSEEYSIPDYIDSEYADFLEFKKSRMAPTKKQKKKLPNVYQGGNVDNVLVIGDLHEPFCLKNYLTHCRQVQEEFDCGTVIFIGDVIDNHFSSYHESDPDGYAAGQELDRAIDKIADWHLVFPNSTVLIGNHDRLVYRKATTAGVSRKWVRDLDEVLQTPTWNFIEEIDINGINYNHGEGGTARNRMKVEHQSQVQGHLHSQAYVEHSVGPNTKIFGMQVGCGIDRKAYAMAYGKNYKKPIISCGVILNKGTLPFVVPMNLN
jgi:hypothetical protein